MVRFCGFWEPEAGVEGVGENELALARLVVLDHGEFSAMSGSDSGVRLDDGVEIVEVGGAVAYAASTFSIHLPSSRHMEMVACMLSLQYGLVREARKLMGTYTSLMNMSQSPECTIPRRLCSSISQPHVDVWPVRNDIL